MRKVCDLRFRSCLGVRLTLLRVDLLFERPDVAFYPLNRGLKSLLEDLLAYVHLPCLHLRCALYRL